jgi:bacillithiol system protein YtxJ
MRLSPFTAPTAAGWLEALAPGEVVLLFKHSPACGTSHRARAQVEGFAAGRPELPVVEIDVLRQRGLSRDLAERLGIRHESPQAILLSGGVPVWHASHSSITAATLTDALSSHGAA